MIVNVKLSIPDANVYSEDVNDFLGTQVALMQIDAVINRVKYRLRTEHPELRAAPVDINVTLTPKSSIFNLRAVGEEANYTQAYLQTTMDEYINLKRELFAKASAATQSSMKDQLAQLGVELQKSKDDLINFQSSNNVVFLQPNGENDAADYLSSLTRKLAEKKSELQLSKTLSLDENLERQQGLFDQPNLAAPPLDPGAVQEQLSSHAQRAAPRQKSGAAAQANPLISSNDLAQENLPHNLGEFEMNYLQAKQQLISLEAERSQDIGLGIATDAEMVRVIDRKIAQQETLLKIYEQQSKEQLKNRQHVLEMQIKSLEDEVKAWELKALDASKKLTAYEALKENQKRLQTRYDQMQANLQTLDMDKGMGQESVTILEPATPPEFVSPDVIKHLIMAGLIGVVLGVGIVVFKDRLNDRPSSPTELEQLFPMPVLGQFPLMKPKNRKAGVPILQLDDDRYPLIEAYRSLRSALLYRDFLGDQPKDQSKSIVITSASPSDGKTMVAANFAITLAQAGARVLLIDADLRRGVLHKHFSVTSSPGLAEVLGGLCDWSTAVVQTPIPNLHVLPRGTSPSHSINLFATPGKFLADIAGHYDYYVFDTAPVMVGDDVLSLAPHVDGLIMVIRAGFTSGRVTQAALEMLRVRRVNVIGLVFNAVHPKATDYYYNRYKKYYPHEPPK